MATLTQKQIDNCKVLNLHSKKINDIHAEWYFKVQDEDGDIYEWTDAELAEESKDEEIKASINSYLLTRNKVLVVTKDEKTDLINKNISEI